MLELSRGRLAKFKAERFAVRSKFMRRYEIQQVGGAHHTEWWIPAEELQELNDNIVGRIEVIGEYWKGR